MAAAAGAALAGAAGRAMGAAAEGASPASPAAGGKRPRTILLRSSWQTVNIGDIGHTPGALTLIERYLPDAEVILWPTSVGNGVDVMLMKRFPRLKIVTCRLDRDGKPLDDATRDAFARADLMVHGSGPSVVAAKHLAAWHKATGKPYGVYGVTVGTVTEDLRDLLSGAAFVFCRDTVSLEVIKSKGVRSPVMEFAPDATFAIDLRDDARAAVYLKAAGLEDRRFICAIPRLRHTPYYRIRGTPPTAEDHRKEAEANRYKEVDHAKLREAIVTWVRKTGLKVLACPEMTYEMALAKEMLVDPLPDDVRRQVVWRETYWQPDEAASVYARAHTVVSIEMHSPIMAAAMGTPAFYVRTPTDTSKGQMWRDVGLKDWIFEIDDVRGEDIARTLLAVHADYPAAQATLAKAMEFVRRRQKETMGVVARTLG